MMCWKRVCLAMVGGLVVALGAGVALAGEGRPERPRQPWQRPGQRPMVVRQPMPMLGGKTGENLPAVRQEMARYRKALRQVLVANLSLAREIDRALGALRQAGAEPEELEAAAKELAPQARELAKKHAEALATHYENLAKIFRPGDEKKLEVLVRRLAEDLVKQMVGRPMRIQPRPPMMGPPGGGPRVFPRGPGERPRGAPPLRRPQGGERGPDAF